MAKLAKIATSISDSTDQGNTVILRHEKDSQLQRHDLTNDEYDAMIAPGTIATDVVRSGGAVLVTGDAIFPLSAAQLSEIKGAVALNEDQAIRKWNR